MSVSSKNIKSRLQSVKQTRKITNAMYLLSTARMKKDLPNAEYRVNYAAKLKNAVDELMCSKECKKFNSPYLTVNTDLPKLYLVITGDKGLCGSYNSDVIQKAKEEIKPIDNESPIVYGFGKTAGELLKNAGIAVSEVFEGSASHPNREIAGKLTDKLLSDFLSGRAGEINIICNSLARKGEAVQVVKLLPLKRENSAFNEVQTVFEPDFSTVFERTLNAYCFGTVYSILSLCALSENNARMNAMKAAVDNADEMSAKLESEMNAQRQLSITGEITESAAARRSMERD